MIIGIGEIKMTIKEIAAMCGVSPSTVSNIINGKQKASGETAKRVLSVVEQQNFRPNHIAQGLRRQSTFMIGVIADDMTMFSTPQISDGIMKCCQEHKYTVLMEDMRLYSRWQDSWFHNSRKYLSVLQPSLEELVSLSVDGIIYIAGHSRKIEAFEDIKLPMVTAYSSTTNEHIPSVIIDDEKGGYELTKYIISKGHTKIGVLAGEQDNLHTQARIRGFQRALFENVILFDLNMIHYVHWNRQGGYDGAAYFADKDVTALFGFSDEISAGAYDFFREKAVEIGKDISIVGYDNREMAEYLYPGLTTMQLPLVDIGYASADILIKMLKGQKFPDNYVEKLSCEFVERESVFQK